jgi:hypothetical protein
MNTEKLYALQGPLSISMNMVYALSVGKLWLPLSVLVIRKRRLEIACVFRHS